MTERRARCGQKVKSEENWMRATCGGTAQFCTGIVTSRSSSQKARPAPKPRR